MGWSNVDQGLNVSNWITHRMDIGAEYQTGVITKGFFNMETRIKFSDCEFYII